MAKEIERKVLVNSRHPTFSKLMETNYSKIRQGNIMSSPTGVVRVRVEDGFASLAIKGVTTGISRNEYEYEIPIPDAEQLLADMCSKVIEKNRYLYPLRDGLVAEVDVFPQIDLCIAEVELPSEETEFEKPEWFTEEVSHDPQYFNNNIAKRI
ncbi:CYTH domain-containing protein [Roseovarius phycicola]|uniref:CYTH domain-containing protein n=1 Tax=Roseovarius phycicola TaxID=3080976 RepID=A0ABZ2HIX3_9RHOB